MIWAFRWWWSITYQAYYYDEADDDDYDIDDKFYYWCSVQWYGDTADMSTWRRHYSIIIDIIDIISDGRDDIIIILEKRYSMMMTTVVMTLTCDDGDIVIPNYTMDRWPWLVFMPDDDGIIGLWYYWNYWLLLPTLTVFQTMMKRCYYSLTLRWRWRIIVVVGIGFIIDDQCIVCERW